MKQSFFVESVFNVDPHGLSVGVDLEKTNDAINRIMIHCHKNGFVIDSVVPIQSGIGQYECGAIPQKGLNLTKWMKLTVGGFGYGLGYSYTSGFFIIANKDENDE